MRIGIAADHGGFELKQILKAFLKEKGYDMHDFGAKTYDAGDDYPDLILPLAEAISNQEIDKGIAVCGSGVGAAIVANKIAGVRAALINDHFSAHQGVEDDDMNLICLGGRVTGYAAAQEYAQVFLEARFSGLERHKRRLEKVISLENRK